MALAALPRRDEHARRQLAEAARGARPVVLARDRILPVPGPVGERLPSGGLQRGTVTTVHGPQGAGATSLALHLAAAASAAGEWVAAVDGERSLGGIAAREAGIALDRLAVVRGVSPRQWAATVAALLDGVALVLACTPAEVRTGDARGLIARARERGAILVVLGAWPAEAVLRLHATGASWDGLGDDGTGLLATRPLEFTVEGRGAGMPVDVPATGRLARAG
ncbi:MAG: hypothetical protein JOZ99_14150 [Actinobacteria bacterium]|nr:hypothetical protein [Actinomycetota bacterium]